MKAQTLLIVPAIAAALAMMPQDPAPQNPQLEPGSAPPEMVVIATLSELVYDSLQGQRTSVPASNVVEVRFLENVGDHLRIELVYENGDYSMIDAQSVHLLRNGSGKRDVRLVRTGRQGLRFPRLP